MLTCNGSPIGGEQLIPGSSHRKLHLRQPLYQQCIADGSFDSYYQEWCGLLDGTLSARRAGQILLRPWQETGRHLYPDEAAPHFVAAAVTIIRQKGHRPQRRVFELYVWQPLHEPVRERRHLGQLLFRVVRIHL